MSYRAPLVTDLGSVHDLTQALPAFNKVGSATDALTNANIPGVPNGIVGSFVQV